MRRIKSLFLILLLVVLTSGCMVGPKVLTYSGDKLQKSEVAVIKGRCFYGLLGYECIDIYKIDGSSLDATNVEVLPGMHDLEIRWYSVSFVSPMGGPARTARVDFNFEAGHEYEIKAQFEGITRKGANIIDVTTGAKILSLWYWSQEEWQQIERKILNQEKRESIE
jgi:hypothetical protein